MRVIGVCRSLRREWSFESDFFIRAYVVTISFPHPFGFSLSRATSIDDSQIRLADIRCLSIFLLPAALTNAQIK